MIAYRGAVGHVSRWDPSCYLKWLNPRIDRIVCVSKAVQDDLATNGVPRKNLTTIYKGHDLDWYQEISPKLQRNYVRAKYQIPDDATVVGMAANMRRVKGTDVLLRAMEFLPKNIHLILIGEVRDPIIEHLIKKGAFKDRVHLTGYRKDAPRLISAVDIVVAPSRGREGLTKGVIEAMVHQIPAVVSDAGGLPELVDHDRCGFIVKKEDPFELARALEFLAENPERRLAMGVAAKQKIINQFSIHQTILQTLALYRELLDA
jgi:glycosyltransferase involved in cell wall biosynthesis